MNATPRRVRGPVSASLALLGLALLALAQPSGPSPLSPPANGPRHADSTWHAFTHAMVHVSPEKTLDDATVVIKDGRIVSVGKDAPPPGARVWDCTGQHLYAGFIDAYVEVDAPKPDKSTPGVHWSPKVTPQRSALDGTGLDDKSAEGLRKLGFTAAAIAPKGGVFRGSGAVVSLAKPSTESSADRPPVYKKDAYQAIAFELRSEGGRRRGGGEDAPPDSERWSSYPDSEMGAIALIRQTLIDADWQADARKAGATIAPNALDPLSATQTISVSNDGGPARVVPTHTMLLFSTEDELEALRAAKIGSEFKRGSAILGSGTEFRRLDALKADGLPIVLPLNYPKTPDVSSVGKADAVELRDLMTWEQAPTNPRRLDAAGLKVALTTAKLKSRADFEDNLRTALRCGLKPERALAMLTTQPAEILGVQDRLGTIEPGKQANFIIADADLFDPWPKKKEDRTTDFGGSAPKSVPNAADKPVDEEHRLPKAEVGGTKPPPTEGQKPAGKEVEPEKKPNADTPDRAADLSGSEERSVPEGNNDRPNRDRPKSKIREVWIDGTRHELVPPPARDVYGTWKVIEIDGKSVDEPDHEAVIFTVTQDNAVTYYRAGKSEKASNVRISESRLEYTIDAKKLFDIPAVLTDSGLVDQPDLMHGITPMPSGKLHHWTARRTSHEAKAPPSDTVSRGVPAPVGQPAGDPNRGETPRLTQKEPGAPPSGRTDITKVDVAKVQEGLREIEEGKPHRDREPRRDPEQEERDAIASIPETYGYPFGPYMLDKEPEQNSLLFRHVTIWTSGPAGIIQDGVLAIAGGKIQYVGPAKEWDAHDKQSIWIEIDATGKHISPGIIDCHSHTGISRGVNEGGQAVTAEVRIQDVTDPDSVSWYRQLGAGVTTVNSLHGSANAIGGQNCVNKNRWGVKHPDEMHLEGAMPGIKFALGENPKQSNWGDRQVTRYPQTRMGVETLIRDRFTAAKEYLQQRAFSGEMPGDGGSLEPSLRAAGGKIERPLPPHRDLELEALAEILQGKRLVHSHSYRQDELLMLCRVADDFGFKIGTFQHVLEGYKVADEIARHARGGSTFSDWWAYKVEVQDAIPENGPIMTSQGVVVSYNSDSDELARRLNTEAAKAVKYGNLKPEDALKYVTINPAIQLAIQDKVGSLEKGKDADFVIWSGPPMSTFSRPEATYVDGRCLFSLEQDKAHRETIQEERSRLIQKALAAAKRKPPERTGPNAADRGIEGPWYRPTDDGASADSGDHHRTGLLERYYLDLLNRGGDPTASRPGECGCGGQN